MTLASHGWVCTSNLLQDAKAQFFKLVWSSAHEHAVTSTAYIAGELPQTVQLKVVEAEPYARGDSATSSYKQCTVESGARVAVPPYVQPGESIVVDTASGTFAKRVTL